MKSNLNHFMMLWRSTDVAAT